MYTGSSKEPRHCWQQPFTPSAPDNKPLGKGLHLISYDMGPGPGDCRSHDDDAVQPLPRLLGQQSAAKGGWTHLQCVPTGRNLPVAVSQHAPDWHSGWGSYTHRTHGMRVLRSASEECWSLHPSMPLSWQLSGSHLSLPRTVLHSCVNASRQDQGTIRPPWRGEAPAVNLQGSPVDTAPSKSPWR